MATPRKYSDKQIRELAEKLPDAVYDNDWDVTKAAQALGLEDGYSLRGLMANYPLLQSAYKRGVERVLDSVQGTYIRAANGKERGLNTQASGRLLAAQRPDDFADTSRVQHTVESFSPPEQEDKKDDQPSAFAVIMGNGGAPANRGGAGE